MSFCNNSGPAFILGAVGAGIFSSSTVGWLLYLAHTAASLTVGLLFRFYKYREPLAPKRAEQTVPVVKVSQAFVGSVRSSFNAILGVCSFVIFFAVAIRMLYVFGVLGTLGTLFGGFLRPFGIAPDTIEKLLAGMIEVTSGLWALQDLSIAIAQKLAMAAFMLGWAGISIHCQVLTFIGNSGLRAWTYVAGKMLHGVISTVYVILLMNVLNIHLPVSSYLMGQMEDLTRLDFGSTLTGTLRVAAVISGVLVFWCAATLLKRNWKRI